MPYQNGFILSRSEWLHVTVGTHPLQATGLNHMTLLQQIRLWMRTRSEGNQYHDCENNSVIEPYFDISPEAVLSPDAPEITPEEIE